jgi:hypothetical protein
MPKTLFSVLNTCHFKIFKTTYMFRPNLAILRFACFQEDFCFFPVMLVRPLVLKILKWQVLRTLKSVLDIDKPHKRRKKESESCCRVV